MDERPGREEVWTLLGLSRLDSSSLTRTEAYDLARSVTDQRMKRQLTTTKNAPLFSTDSGAAHHRILKNKNHLTSKPSLVLDKVDHRRARTIKDLFNEIMGFQTLTLMVLLFSVIVVMWLVFALFYFYTNSWIINRQIEEMKSDQLSGVVNETDLIYPWNEYKSNGRMTSLKKELQCISFE